MEMFYEKIEMVQTEVLFDLFLVGKKVYETINGPEDFIGCLPYVSELNLLIESINGTKFNRRSKVPT